MAEEARKKADPAGAAGGEKSAKAAGGIKALLSKTPVLLGGVMLIEAVVLFAG